MTHMHVIEDELRHFQPRSRVHELASRSFTELLALYQITIEQTRQPGHTGVVGVTQHRTFSDKDQVITAIREIEDPR